MTKNDPRQRVRPAFLPPAQAKAKKAGRPGKHPQTREELTALALAATARVVPLGVSSLASGELAPRSTFDRSKKPRT